MRDNARFGTDSWCKWRLLKFAYVKKVGGREGGMNGGVDFVNPVLYDDVHLFVVYILNYQISKVGSES